MNLDWLNAAFGANSPRGRLLALRGELDALTVRLASARPEERPAIEAELGRVEREMAACHETIARDQCGTGRG